MLNLLLILVAVFAALFVLIKVLEGRAEPLSPEKQASLSRAIVFLVILSLVVMFIRELL